MNLCIGLRLDGQIYPTGYVTKNPFWRFQHVIIPTRHHAQHAMADSTGNESGMAVLRLVQSLAPAVSYKESNVETNRKLWDMYAKVLPVLGSVLLNPGLVLKSGRGCSLLWCSEKRRVTV